MIVGLAGVLPSHAAPQCASTASAGGDWPSEGGTPTDTRSQPAEHTIDPTNALNLTPKWHFNASNAGDAGIFQGIPVEANGCVYIQTSSGGNAIYALNADTGELVWSHALGSGGCHDAPVVRDGKVYVNDPTQYDSTVPGSKGPHLVVFDAYTGAVLVDGDGVATEPNTGANAGCAAPVALYNNVALIGITNGETDGARVGGYALVDATTGKLISRHYVVPDDEANAGFGGCSIWTSFAIDAATQTAYTGTAQPSTWGALGGHDSEFCNALIKIDLNPLSPTYGDIIGAMKGTPDAAPYLDVDFGTGVTMLNDAYGRQIVAATEKSGYVHAAYTRFMTHAWSTPVSPIGIPLGNYTPAATDGHNVFSVGAYPGQMFSLDGTTGTPNWVTPVGSPFASTSVAYANGVVYYGNEAGDLVALNASNGTPLYVHPIAAEDSGCQRDQSGGVAVARNLIYVGCGGVLDVFGL
jgi:outer membrane protein assembly factor BamB